MPTIRLPRLTRDSLEGTPGGAYQTAQKDASVSWSRYMIVLLVTQSKRIVACEARCREPFSAGGTGSRLRNQRRVSALLGALDLANARSMSGGHFQSGRRAGLIDKSARWADACYIGGGWRSARLELDCGYPPVPADRRLYGVKRD